MPICFLAVTMALTKPHSEIVYLRDDIYDDEDDSDEEEQVIIHTNDNGHSSTHFDTPPAYINVDDSWESSGFYDSGLSTLCTTPSFRRKPSNVSFLRILCDEEDDATSSGRGTDRYTSSTQRTAGDEDDMRPYLETDTARQSQELPDIPSQRRSCSRRSAIEPPRAESASSVSTTSEQSSSQRLLTKRQFHTTGFLRARYPTHLHQEFAKTKKLQFQPPPCLCPASRYGKEPRVQSACASRSQARPGKTPARCPQPPRCSQRGRHVEKDCHILRKMETLSISVQCEPEMCTCSAQTETTVRHVASQSHDVTARDSATQTGGLDFSEQATQCTPQMSNKLTETSIRVLFQLPEVNALDAATQCSSTGLTADAEIQCEIITLGATDSLDESADTFDVKDDSPYSHRDDRPEETISNLPE